MGRHRTARIITSPAEMRAAARRGEWHATTGGQCPAYQQANLVILSEEAAAESLFPSTVCPVSRSPRRTRST